MAGIPPPRRGAAPPAAAGVIFHPPRLSECVVCGPASPAGLRIRFRRRGDTVTTGFTPGRAHQGYHGLMSGGLVAAIFDCLHYRVALVMGVPSAVTARLEVDYRAPIPLGRRVRFEVRLASRRGRVFESVATARLAGGALAAESRAVYVEIPPERLPAPPVRARGGLPPRGRVR